MSRFLTFCLLLVPFAHALSVLPEPEHHDDVFVSDHEMEEKIYENITSHAKREFLPPVTPNEDGEHGPVHVAVNAYVRNILEFKTVDKNLYDWTVDLTFRQKWHDQRLAYDASHHPHIKYITLNTATGLKSVWKPDTFFSNTVTGDFHFLLAPNALLWVYPNGDVLYSIRITLTLRCHPIDPAHPEEEKHEEGAEKDSHLDCPMRLASYGFTTDKLEYNWDDDETHTPVQISKGLYLAHYNLNNVTTEADKGTTKIGEFSSLTANFHFTHK